MKSEYSNCCSQLAESKSEFDCLTIKCAEQERQTERIKGEFELLKSGIDKERIVFLSKVLQLLYFKYYHLYISEFNYIVRKLKCVEIC